MNAPPKMTAPKKKVPVKPVPIIADARFVEQTCSICSSGVAQGESIVECPYCKLPFHSECWTEIGGCGNYGCQAVPEVPKADYGPQDQFVPGWSAQKKCPSCASLIIAAALKCKFCHAEFPNEKPMTLEEYENREYTGNEATHARNMVILNFIFSVVGCLCLLTIPHNLYLLTSGQGTFFKVRRLPDALKVLFYASTVISISWIPIGILVFLLN